jgi:cytochrome c-type biogenesis protein CcmH
MIWLIFGLLALAAVAPLALSLLRPRRPRGRQAADQALYAAQRAELEREAAAGRLDPEAHRAALLEIQRRLLGAPADAAPVPGGQTAALLAALVFLLPAIGLGLYLLDGTPEIPAAPYVERRAAAQRDEALMGQLRARLAQMPPESESARQGWLLLGQAERARGNLAGAAEAWTRVLAARFDPGVAAELAEVELQRGEVEAAGRWIAQGLAAQPDEPRLRYLAGLAEAQAGRTENARSVWRQLLAAAPPDAPWRALVERRLQELP